MDDDDLPPTGPQLAGKGLREGRLAAAIDTVDRDEEASVGSCASENAHDLDGFLRHDLIEPWCRLVRTSGGSLLPADSRSADDLDRLEAEREWWPLFSTARHRSLARELFATPLE
ncbi:hypothetical protein [Nocardioides albertanoniae]|uniref:hypothetical protein n=1 Tax=Nocardioides albertanoniae TaxID=1175486 RepID=UPI001FECAE38|nr:hypothetical protein [Nocardioides albertanoniae]